MIFRAIRQSLVQDFDTLVGSSLGLFRQVRGLPIGSPWGMAGCQVWAAVREWAVQTAMKCTWRWVWTSEMLLGSTPPTIQGGHEGAPWRCEGVKTAWRLARRWESSDDGRPEMFWPQKGFSYAGGPGFRRGCKHADTWVMRWVDDRLMRHRSDTRYGVWWLQWLGLFHTVFHRSARSSGC
jgi:hypothetical protein